MKFLIFSSSIILLLFLFESCSDNPLENQNGNGAVNRPPEITSIIANPDTVLIGLNSNIICNAEDPDNDELGYNWV